MKRLKKLVAIVVMTCMVVLSNIGYVRAASFGVSVKNNGNGKVTVTISGKVVGAFNVSAGSASGTIPKRQLDESASTTLKTGAGTFTVKVTGISVSNEKYETTKGEVVTKSITVTDKSSSSGSSGGSSGSSGSSNSSHSSDNGSTTPTTPQVDNRSKENALSSLTVSEGTLSPKFDASTTKYTVNLEGDKTKVKISASAKDSKADVSGTGEKELDVGKNTFVVKCTAENGSTRNYTIEVNVDEKPLVFTKLGDNNLGVVRNLSGVEAPSGFEKGTTKVGDKDVDGWTNDKFKLTICYLIDDNNKKAFYVIEDGKAVYKFENVQIDGRSFIIIPIDDKLKERTNFTFQKVALKELELDGWVYNDKAMENYVQVYLMNENGEKNLYDYEKTEEQLQKYTEVEKKEPFNIFIITTMIFAGISGGLLFLYLNFKKKSISSIKDYYSQKENQQ